MDLNTNKDSVKTVGTFLCNFFARQILHFSYGILGKKGAVFLDNCKKDSKIFIYTNREFVV